VLEKALYELAYELNYRPAWVHIPLAGIAQLTRSAPDQVPHQIPSN
jgi:maltose alpha-D-glucosyltransferase/alpha-amylase